MKIVFFHMNQLGDLLFSLPVLSGARATWPDAHLACVARPPLVPLLGATGLVNEVITRAGDGLLSTMHLAGELRKRRFDRAVFFSESPGSLLAGAAAHIPRRTGFGTASFALLLTERSVRTGVPSLANNRSMAQAAGIGNVPENYCGIVKIPGEVREKAARWLSEHNTENKAVFVITPGASRRRAEKHWEPARWRELAERMRNEGLFVIAAGASREKEILERVSDKVFAPDDGIIDLAAMMSLSRAVISIDSGAMHLAAAVGKPVIALFGPTDPSQVGPLPVRCHQVIRHGRMDQITVDEVMRAVKKEIGKDNN